MQGNVTKTIDSWALHIGIIKSGSHLLEVIEESLWLRNTTGALTVQLPRYTSSHIFAAYFCVRTSVVLPSTRPNGPGKDSRFSSLVPTPQPHVSPVSPSSPSLAMLKDALRTVPSAETLAEQVLEQSHLKMRDRYTMIYIDIRRYRYTVDYSR